MPMELPRELAEPPREFSVMPFWFWTDALDEDEIVRQIDDMERHGVFGFVLHPRVGLPRELGWMSDRLLHFYRIAIDEARRRRMHVLLYDEGMYPSGSSAGQVVAEDPAFACRCLAKRDLPGEGDPDPGEDENLVAVVRRRDGTRMAVVDRRADSHIRGLHYAGEGPAEERPPAADILNPDAVKAFLRLVYDRFARRFADDFGETILGIFTDEPMLLGRGAERGVKPGTRGILAHVNRILGYDFTPHLPALWHDDEPGAERFRAEYRRALFARLEETYFGPLSEWCEAHRLPLTGHPESGDSIGPLRHFHIPGQDLVWRWVLPDHPSALEGRESTQGKCTASAALHAGRRRNANECCGAYGHELTWDEMQWLARWCFVRGVNFLFPHAFYYSVRGPRRDERPPDVGPNSPWWDRYREYADACRRLSWLNTDCEHVCDVAILGRAYWLPWRSAKVCFRRQRDFNYLPERDLFEDATIDGDGIRIAGMTYRALVLEHDPDAEVAQALEPCRRAGRLVRYEEGMPDADFAGRIDAITPADVRVEPAVPALRVRHVRKGGFHWYLLFNEGRAPLRAGVDFSVKGDRFLFDPAGGVIGTTPHEGPFELGGHALQVVAVAEGVKTPPEAK
jgi:hypothetical protein